MSDELEPLTDQELDEVAKCEGWPPVIHRMVAQIREHRAEVDRCREIAERDGKDYAELQQQLRQAQEVINRHVADQIEGMHCVDCTAEEDEVCDCPMVAPIFAAMKGFEGQPEKRSCGVVIAGGAHCAFLKPCPDHAAKNEKRTDETA